MVLKFSWSALVYACTVSSRMPVKRTHSQLQLELRNHFWISSINKLENVSIACQSWQVCQNFIHDVCRQCTWHHICLGSVSCVWMGSVLSVWLGDDVITEDLPFFVVVQLTEDSLPSHLCSQTWGRQYWRRTQGLGCSCPHRPRANNNQNLISDLYEWPGIPQ
jgi:hypothetical protein